METSYFEGQTFTRESFRELVLSGREYSSCSFSCCDFSGANLRESSFDDCFFETCNLSNPDLADARLVDPRFSDCKLAGIDFWRLGQASFDLAFFRCVLQGCNFSGLKLKRSVFQDCLLQGCSFQDAWMQECRFDGSSFKETLFHKTNLQKASFRGAQGYDIDPRTNDIKRAVFSLPEAVSLLSSFDIVLKGQGPD